MSSGLRRRNGQQTREVVLSDASGRRWDLTESRSSMTRWGLDAEEGLVPLSLLNCVNKMFMVARSTSERLCLICTERNTRSEEKEPSSWADNRRGGPPGRPGSSTPPQLPRGELHSHHKGAKGTDTLSVAAKPRQRPSGGSPFCSLLYAIPPRRGSKKHADHIRPVCRLGLASRGVTNKSVDLNVSRSLRPTQTVSTGPSRA